MNFCKFLLYGTTAEWEADNYKNFHALAKEKNAVAPNIEKITLLWENLKTSSSVLTITCLVGMISGGAILASNVTLVGVALLTVSIALGILSFVRSRFAEDQLTNWKDIDIYRTPDSKTQLVSKPPADKFADYRSSVQNCLQYYERIPLSCENPEVFINDFFQDKNPLSKIICPPECNENVYNAFTIYQQLKLRYLFLPRELQLANLKLKGDLQVALLTITDTVDNLIRQFEIVHNHLMNVKQITQIVDLKKLKLIRDFIIESIKTAGCNASLQIEESSKQFITYDLVQERNNYIALITKKIMEFVSAFNKNDLSSFMLIEEFESKSKWICPVCYFPMFNQITYDPKKLCGVTDSEYQKYLVKDFSF